VEGLISIFQKKLYSENSSHFFLILSELLSLLRAKVPSFSLFIKINKQNKNKTKTK